jgi:hypothetical protein
MSLQLYALFVPNEPDYEGTRQMLIDLLNNLWLSVQQANLIISLREQLTQAQNRNGILNNIDTIEQYLNQLRKQNNLYKTTISTVAAVLKPEYAIYVQKYGIPVNGIFQADKMAAILLSLQK